MEVGEEWVRGSGRSGRSAAPPIWRQETLTRCLGFHGESRAIYMASRDWAAWARLPLVGRTGP